MQCCAIGYGAASSDVHVRHVHCHRTIFYLVCWRHFLERSPNSRHTCRYNTSFTQECIVGETLDIISARQAARLDASGTGVLESDEA